MMSHRQQQQRRCSFCRSTGHTVRFCMDQRLFDFKDNLRDNFNEFVGGPFNRATRFVNWLKEELNNDAEKTRIFKAVAVQCGGCSLNDSLQQQMEAVAFHFITIGSMFTEQEEEEEEEEEEDDETVSDIDIFDEHTVDWDTGVVYQRVRVNGGVCYRMVVQNPEINVSLLQPGERLSRGECAICYENCRGNNFVRFNCDHAFCKTCTKRILETTPSHKLPACAFCRQTVSHIRFATAEIQSDCFEHLQKFSVKYL